jgi:hypothetical protein
MRYPANAHREGIEGDEEQRGRERELAQFIQDNDVDDDDMDEM